MYSVKRVLLCRFMASLVCIMSLKLNNVISTQQNQLPNQRPTTSTSKLLGSSDLSRMSRLIQYDDLPLVEHSELNSFADQPPVNHSLFRAPTFQEPILEPMDSAGVLGLAGSNIVENTGNSNNNCSGSNPTTSVIPIDPMTNSNESKQTEEAVASSTVKNNLTKLKNDTLFHLNPINNLTISSKRFNTTASSGFRSPSLPTTTNKHLMPRHMVSSELQRQIEAARLQALRARHPIIRPPNFEDRIRSIAMNPAFYRHQVVRTNSESKPLSSSHFTISRAPYSHLFNSLTSKIRNLFNPQSATFTQQPPTNEVTRLNWAYPKKRRTQLPQPVPRLKMLRVGQRLPPSLAQSASHLNSYTLDPAVDADLDGEFFTSHQHDSTAIQLAQEEASDEFPVELDTNSFRGSGVPLTASEYPVTLAGDSTTDQQALLLSSVVPPREQLLKKRRKSVKLPLGTLQLATSYPDSSNFLDQQPLHVVGSSLLQPQATSPSKGHSASTSSNVQGETPVEVDEVKESKPQQVAEDEEKEQAFGSTDRRRKPLRVTRVRPKQKRAKHPTRMLRPNKNLQNFYDHGPTAGDLQPSSTFLRWKYPQLYDDNDEEGETELNIRFFNNFSRVGPLTGLGRNVATATLIISLVLLIMSNICMVGTYVVHGLSALSTFYGLPTITSNAPPSFMAKPKNVTSLSYANWDSLLPPFIRNRPATTTTTTLAPLLAGRSLLPAQHHQLPSMTFDSEIEALGETWK